MRMICIVVLLLLLLPVVCGQVDLRTSMFIHYKQKVTWNIAQNFCREYHTDLVTIRSQTDNQKIYYTQGWIGLYRDDSDGPWKWSRRAQIANFISWSIGGKQVSKLNLEHDSCRGPCTISLWFNVCCPQQSICLFLLSQDFQKLDANKKLCPDEQIKIKFLECQYCLL